MLLAIRNLTLILLIPFLARPALSEDHRTELTLQECYDRARQVSESLARRAEDIQAAEAVYQQALSQLYPNLHLLADHRWRDDNFQRGSSASNDDPEEGSSRGSGNKNQFESLIQVRQPLFTGFRESYLARAAQAKIQATSLDRDRSAELLYLDVANLFFQILFYDQDTQILTRTQSVLDQRVNELKHFLELGRSREGELLAARSDIDDIEAEHERSLGLLGASREMLAFLINMPASQFSLKRDEAATIPNTLDAYLERVSERFDVKAMAQRVYASSETVVATERLTWPNLSLEGSYYPYEDPDNGRDAEIFLRFDLPLYDGGGLQAQATEQRARHRAAVLALQENKRTAERDVRVAYSDFLSAKSEATKLRSLLASALKNDEIQRRDYELGVVTNLEVLQAIRTRQDAERRLLTAETQTRVNFVRLQVAAGGI